MRIERIFEKDLKIDLGAKYAPKTISQTERQNGFKPTYTQEEREIMGHYQYLYFCCGDKSKDADLTFEKSGNVLK